MVKKDQDWETRDTVGGTESRSAESPGQTSSESVSKVGGYIDGIKGYDLPGKALLDVLMIVIRFILVRVFDFNGFLIVIGA